MILLLRVHAPLVLILVIVLLGKPYAIHGFGSSFPSQINPLTYDTTTILRSSFYEDFDINDDEDDDDDDDDDDNDNDYEYEEIDQRSIADFKSKMSKLMDDQKEAESTTIGSKSDNVRLEDGSGTIGSVDELIEFARKQQQEEKSRGTGSGGTDEKEKETIVDDWAKPVNEIRPGTVLIANPRKFCEEGDFGDSGGDSAATINEKTGIGKSFFGGLGLSSVPAPSLLSKFGLTQPPPRTLGADRQADLLPVVIVVNNDGGQIQGVLLNRRTGYLLGDLEQPASGDDSSNSNNDDMTPILEKFCIQPLWFGGIEQKSVGLDMLHLCPAVNNAKRITEDGMYWGGDPTQAQVNICLSRY